MKSDASRLLRWLRRAAPPRRALIGALVASIASSLLNTALLVGAVTLLVQSATRPGLRAVLGVLIVIELFAFLRSPLRYAERLSAHRLGFAAVSHWRRWLLLNVGRWNFSRWRTYAAGDLLERSLGDTDELQDLWLRFMLPLASTVTVMVAGDLFIGLLPPFGRWWVTSASLFIAQLIGVVALAANLAPLVRLDKNLRAARGRYQAHLIELSGVAPDLLLLGRSSFTADRSNSAVGQLRRAERALRRQHWISGYAVFTASLLALGALLSRPLSSPVWTVAVVMVSAATYELLLVVRGALDTALSVSAGAERLEDLSVDEPATGLAWPGDSTLCLRHATLSEGATTLLVNGSLLVPPGRRIAVTGESGSGKSTLLRALAALDVLDDGAITVGNIALGEILETEVRQHLAYVPSEPGLVRGFVTDVVGLGRESSRDVHLDLAALGIVTDSASQWDQLSRGERARIAVVRALVSSPEIMLLDEPTSSLGAAETAAVLEILARSRATVIVATHDPQVIAWCDDVVELANASLRPVSR